jgi:hypothetical protein
MLWLIGVCCVLCILSLGLGIKIILLRKAADEISEGLEEKLKEDTNTLISISSRDVVMCRFAHRLNIQLRELRRQRHQFRQGDLELKNAITNISHDIRTPLSAICAYLDLLDTCEKSSEVAEYLSVIKGRADILRQLTEELFCYSVVMDAEDEPVAAEVVLNGVLEESIGGFYAALLERGITPNVQITEKKIVRKLNASSLSRVISNLINNAIKYSDGDLDITLTDDGEIIFANGASQLNEVQAGKLFDRFYTVEASRKSTGLGLAIAKTLVERMNGRIVSRFRDGKLWISIRFP